MASFQGSNCMIGLFLPNGYMNETGKYVRPLINYCESKNFIIIQDYLDAPLGSVKIKEGGSAE